MTTEQVTAEVVRDIVGGRYDDESRPLRELDVAERHGVSRYVARECLQALRDRGVVRVEHGVGASTLRLRFRDAA